MLWLAECVSAVRGSVFARPITAEEGRTAVEDLFALAMEMLALDAPLCRAAYHWAERLGQARAYAGFYLALADQLGAELWTADERLANGARQAGATSARWVGEASP